ncbi:small GTP-binding protein [Kineothrix alysoides]|uniref:Small GTP-binding protein n=1 Tax=Kineothrix alysoides TaxID=1469948 RepID=A0A4R1R179_9FIRM|nr:TetM/TetW/TetO/TetS family tetracycline resistance ribosomal protection protein [Kineothrix alysoides]TCL59073.1 small GTP-binding protein [Kineothrix alysoides]
MKELVIGILAHVDAGKTTLSEALLYESGGIRKMGRVDNKDAFLDTYFLERERGITIFSKQAVLEFGDMRLTLLDTPGHVDFSAEMERTLQVLDYAILVISGADGVQGHTQTLWRLLKKYQIPTFLFINKMDQNGTDKAALLAELKSRLEEGCICFEEETEAFYENIAMTDEKALNQFLEMGRVETEEIRGLILQRNLFPCYFGSALKLDGVESFLQGIETYTDRPRYSDTFGAKVFKIARDEQGNRLTFMKLTGGNLRTREVISGYLNGEIWEEKVNQIRIYSGEKYRTSEEVQAGCICAVTGLSKTRPGEGLGAEESSAQPVLEPVLTYRIDLPGDCDATVMLPKLRQLEEEDPQLHIAFDETLKEIQAKLMGEVQTEILKSLIKERFGVTVEFGTGNIVYKETIANRVEGVGHFEPLRHYAEVHLLLEPAQAGSGLSFEVSCSEDLLDRNWQRLVLTHLEEKEHKGVLIGAGITDMKITLVAGRAHQKHTEGGDFRQATYRALRQGLKEAQSVLLEPYYEFRLEVPEKLVGRAMTDIEKMCGTFGAPHAEGESAVLTGYAPVITMQDYSKEVTAYTKGCGRLFCTVKGYAPCHNAEEIIEKAGYDSEKDIENPTGSVFCAHGAGFTVSWDKVKEYMHVESRLSSPEKEEESEGRERKATSSEKEERWIGTEEVDAILERVLYANKKGKDDVRRGYRGSMKREERKPSVSSSPAVYEWKKPELKEEYLLVDGYNVIFAWEDLKELAMVSIDGARGKLMDILCNYQAIKRCKLIVVFDAYRVKGHDTEILDYHNIHVVYTKEAETADMYIEKFAHENGRKYKVTVATSDGLEQIIIRGQGCDLFSARELREEIEAANKKIKEDYSNKQPREKNYLFDSLPEDTAGEIDGLYRQ